MLQQHICKKMLKGVRGNIYFLSGGGKKKRIYCKYLVTNCQRKVGDLIEVEVRNPID
jgi:hypothetical protein